LAGVGAGVWSDVDQACEATIQIVDRVVPQADQVEQYAAVYPLYRSLYPTLKSTFDDLTELVL
jgi:xylulokinase